MDSSFMLTIVVTVHFDLVCLEEPNETVNGEYHARLGRVHEANVRFPRSWIVGHGDWQEGARWNVEGHLGVP